MTLHLSIIKALAPLLGPYKADDIFEDWLELTEATLRMLPEHLTSALLHKHIAEDPDDVKALWARVKARHGVTAFQHFAKAFQALLDTTDTYRDALGDVYMEFAHANEASGQFFTPWDVCRMMARMTCGNLEVTVRERMRDRGEPVTIHDPTVGSGRLLLATAALLPKNLARSSWVRFYGQDIDHTCVRMANVNMRLYGLNGTAIWLPTERPKKFPVPPVSRKQPVP